MHQRLADTVMNAPNRFFTVVTLIKNRKFRYLYASLRRRCVYYFFRGYVNRQLEKRKGSCSGQGHCCRMTMAWCAYFVDGKCMMYDRQPFFCRIFPIDQRDQELSDVAGVCSYYFDENHTR